MHDWSCVQAREDISRSGPSGSGTTCRRRGPAAASTPTQTGPPGSWRFKFPNPAARYSTVCQGFRIPIICFTCTQCCGSGMFYKRISLQVHYATPFFSCVTVLFSVGDPHWFQCGSGYGSEEKSSSHKRKHLGSRTSKLEFSSLLWVILALLDQDPDPYPQSGSGSSRPK
jgi:hypothetical protein